VKPTQLTASTVPVRRDFRILAARKLEREQKLNEIGSIFFSRFNSSYAEKFFAQERLCAGSQYDDKNTYGRENAELLA